MTLLRHTQRIGPIVLKYGKQAIKKGLPLLLRELEKQLEDKDKAKGTLSALNRKVFMNNQAHTSILRSILQHVKNPPS